MAAKKLQKNIPNSPLSIPAPWSSKKIYMIMGLSFLAAILIAIGFYFWLQKNPQTAKVSDSDWALAVLNEEEIIDATDKNNLRSQLIEFNDHMEPESPDAPYKSIVGRGTYDRATGQIFFSNALVSFNSKEEAKNFVTAKSKGKQPLALKKQYGENSLAYFEPASEFDPAMVTLRLTQATVAAKVQIFDTSGTVTDVSGAESLLSKAEALAPKQVETIKQVANGFVRFSDETQNSAMRLLPSQVEGATYLGTAKVTESEWLGITHEFTPDGLDGFKSGALSRFKLNSRPSEAVEVVILEFQNEEQAKEYQSGLLVGPAAPDETELELPGSLDSIADGLVEPTLAELQSAQGKFVVDISILSPYEEINKDAAVKDLIIISESLLSTFNK